MDGEVTLEAGPHDGVATMTVSRPSKRNSVTRSMAVQIAERARSMSRDPLIRAIVVRGAGDEAFCAGSDLDDVDDFDTTWDLRNRADQGMDYVGALYRVRKPLIAAVDGYAFGGGLEIALVCDVRIATPSARFAASEIRFGWHSGSGVTQLLPRLVGPGHAARMILTGDVVAGDEAHDIGLVERLVPRDRLLVEAHALAARMAAHAPIAVESAKHMLRVAQDVGVEAGMRHENDMASYCLGTEDAAEGMRAFREQRSPRYRGR